MGTFAWESVCGHEIGDSRAMVTRRDSDGYNNMDIYGDAHETGDGGRCDRAMHAVLPQLISKRYISSAEKNAIQETQERLLGDNGDANSNLTQRPEDQYLSCAILAWQQLGHSGCDSLYQFIEKKRKEKENADKIEKKLSDYDKGMAFKKKLPMSPGSFISYNDPSLSNEFGSNDAVGPVVKLPVNTKIVMRCDKGLNIRQPIKKAIKGVKDKIDAACCMDTACLDKLSQLDKATNELRTRAQKLARREAQRVELLERAEAAWKDLEVGYQRRLRAAEEKEEDITRNIRKMMEERNGYKNACTTLAEKLRQSGDTAEKEQARLSQLEKEVCDNAYKRLQYSEDAGRLDAELAQLQCKNTQLDRDLQFKEEQIRGKLQNMENEVDCARALTHEAERTIHAELSALKDQITAVSSQLINEDIDNGQIREELAQLRQEKMEIVEDLEGCQVMCGGRVQGKLDDLNKRREKLRDLKEKVIECQCKLPVDEAVEVKRTPSLAALCKCAPEDKLSETCSCTSLRTTLLTTLLADLFGGLQTELGGNGSQMPCQLLKCLDDKHNWDKASVVKTNLRKHFSQLLVGELDIAIATSIENYHARWVGASCADAFQRLPPECGASPTECPEAVIERRAQKLASKLAEQLFKERADQLTAKAKEVMKAGPPPCECGGRSAAAVYPCFVKPPHIGGSQAGSSGVATPAYWRRTHQDVTNLRAQLEDLKKVSIKKQDLKMMEENIVKIVQRSVPDTAKDAIGPKQVQNKSTFDKANSLIHRSVNTDKANKHVPSPKLSSIKKKQIDLSPKKGNKNFLLGFQIDKPVKPLKKLGRSYAVNLCLCGSGRITKKTQQHGKQDPIRLKHCDSKKTLKGLAIQDVIPQTSSTKQSKPIISHLQSEEICNGKKNKAARTSCRSDFACFHKPPSKTSIDKLLSTLAKWKCDLFKLNNNCDINKIDACVDAYDDAVEKETSFEENRSKQNRSNVGKTSEVLSKSVSMETSINNTGSYFAKPITVNVSKGTELQADMPVNTESEYMGAVNLEKSNENYCKCVTDTKNNLKLSYKCLNTATCDCNTNAKNKKDQHVPEMPQDIIGQNKSRNRDTIGTSEERYSNTEKNKQFSLTDHQEKKSVHDVSHLLKTTSTFSNDCEYCIKFLGVTLTNANFGKDFGEKEKTCYRIHQTTNGINRENMKKPEPWFKKDTNATIKCNGDDIIYRNNLSSPQTQLASCECSIKYDEFKSLINNVFSKQRGDFCKNEDKSLDTHSLKKEVKLESCICCNGAKTDESKDLEVNAFHLLEEHLRDKLEEFKNSTCKSSCISSIEEEKLFATILQQVRKVISESTGSFACKCIGEEPTEGSFHRAYILLQEYLKLKIRKVQCLCPSSEESKQTVLPAVMEKVRNLIEKDFQRLNDICKCKTSREEVENINIELPERDTNNLNEPNAAMKMVNKCNNEDKETSNQSMVATQNISSQVSSKLGMDQGLDNYNNNLDDLEFHNERCTCIGSKSATKSHVDFGSNGFFVNQCLNVSKGNISASTNDISPTRLKNLLVPKIGTKITSEKDLTPDSNINKKKIEDDKDELGSIDRSRNTQSPYIGYTVDCSCNETLGTCSCTKSMINGNNDNINSIWNTLTSNKLHKKNHSYIMNAVPKTMADIVETDLNKADPIKKYKNPMCDTEISAHDDEEITLKYSDMKIHKTYISTTTSDENVSLEAEGPIDWCGCSTRNKCQKMTHFSDNTCDKSLYFPISKLMNRRRSEAFVKSEPINLPTSISSNCDCNMVPMCHVKMLVENIEKKLIYSKCTCDSMCSKVCPVHSKRNK